MNDIASVGADVIIVRFKSKDITSLAHQDGKTIHARHITSVKRENIGTQLLNNSSKIFHQQFRNDKNVEVFNKENFPDLILQQTLRRIKSDIKSMARFSNDDFADIVETQKFSVRYYQIIKYLVIYNILYMTHL